MTLARALGGGTLDNLTALNQRLIAQVDDQPEVEDGEFIPVGGGDGRAADPNVDDGRQRTPEVRGRFSTEDPLEFNRIKEWIEANIFGGATTGMTPLLNAFVNEWDVEWRRQQGLSPTEQISRGPTLEDLANDESFINGAIWLPLTANNALPSLFESTTVNDETGETVPAVATADPLTGVRFIEVQPDLSGLRDRPKLLAEVVGRGREFLQRVMTDSGAFEGASDELVEEAFAEPDDFSASEQRRVFEQGTGQRTQLGGPTAEQSRLLFETGATVPEFVRTQLGVRQRAESMPVISQDALFERLTSALSTGSGSRGAARRTLEFDKAHLIAQAERLYNRWMLSPVEAPTSVIESTINSYIRDAQAFWSGKGVQLDFDTFVRDRFRKLPRYEHIYQHKLPGQTEEEFLQSFLGPIGGIGLRPELTRMQTEQAVTSGAGPADQLQRISRTREAQLQPGFSQRLARTLAGIGG